MTPPVSCLRGLIRWISLLVSTERLPLRQYHKRSRTGSHMRCLTRLRHTSFRAFCNLRRRRRLSHLPVRRARRLSRLRLRQARASRRRGGTKKSVTLSTGGRRGAGTNLFRTLESMFSLRSRARRRGHPRAHQRKYNSASSERTAAENSFSAVRRAALPTFSRSGWSSLRRSSSSRASCWLLNKKPLRP